MRKAFVLLVWMSLVLFACMSNLTMPEQANEGTVLTSESTPLSTAALPVQELSLEALKNAEYHLGIETFRLVDGIHYLTPLPGESRNDWHIKIDQPIAFGDVNGDGANDAAVTLKSRSGGTGVWRCIAVVVNHGGQPLNIATQCLGDRDRITAIRITDDGVIIADVVIHGPGDAACCPSIETTWRYRLVGTELLKSEQ